MRRLIIPSVLFIVSIVLGVWGYPQLDFGTLNVSGIDALNDPWFFVVSIPVSILAISVLFEGIAFYAKGNRSFKRFRRFVYVLRDVILFALFASLVITVLESAGYITYPHMLPLFIPGFIFMVMGNYWRLLFEYRHSEKNGLPPSIEKFMHMLITIAHLGLYSSDKRMRERLLRIFSRLLFFSGVLLMLLSFLPAGYIIPTAVIWGVIFLGTTVTSAIVVRMNLRQS